MPWSGILIFREFGGYTLDGSDLLTASVLILDARTLVDNPSLHLSYTGRHELHDGLRQLPIRLTSSELALAFASECSTVDQHPPGGGVLSCRDGSATTSCRAKRSLGRERPYLVLTLLFTTAALEFELKWKEVLRVKSAS